MVGTQMIDLRLLVRIDGLSRISLRLLLLGVGLDRLRPTLLLEWFLISDRSHFALRLELLVDDADVFGLLKLIRIVLRIFGVGYFQRGLRDHSNHGEAGIEVMSRKKGALVESILVVSVTLADQIREDLLGLELVILRNFHRLFRRIRVKLLELKVIHSWAGNLLHLQTWRRLPWMSFSWGIPTNLFASSWRSLFSATVVDGRDIGLRPLVDTANKVPHRPRSPTIKPNYSVSRLIFPMLGFSGRCPTFKFFDDLARVAIILLECSDIWIRSILRIDLVSVDHRQILDRCLQNIVIWASLWVEAVIRITIASKNGRLLLSFITWSQQRLSTLWI